MLCALRKFSAALSHSKSCSAPNPRKNDSCAAVEPELAKDTWPKSLSFSACAAEWLVRLSIIPARINAVVARFILCSSMVPAMAPCLVQNAGKSYTRCGISGTDPEDGVKVIRVAWHKE